MPLVDTKKMFEMAYKNNYAIGAFNVNNMEITQGIVDAVAEEKITAYSSDIAWCTFLCINELSQGYHRLCSRRTS